MLISDAKDTARRWVVEEAAVRPGFDGAYYAGSVNWLPDDAEFPATSDVDVMVVVSGADTPAKRGKFLYRGVVIEATYLSSDQLQSPEMILGQYNMAGGFRTPSVIADPTGRLTELQEAVSRDFAKRRWVYKRCEHARDKVLVGLQSLNESGPFHDQVMTWVFPTGVTTHVLLTAGLNNPTVRRRYEAARELLAEYGCTELYEALLEVLGCARMSPERAREHLAALSQAFDAAAAVIKSPFPFAGDISAFARSIAIDGSGELIESGRQREAVFWLVATYSRCRQVFDADAPELQERYNDGYRRLMADLGIQSFADLARRKASVEALIPRVWAAAEDIMAANRGIEG